MEKYQNVYKAWQKICFLKCNSEKIPKSTTRTFQEYFECFRNVRFSENESFKIF